DFSNKVSELAARHAELAPPARPSVDMTQMTGGTFQAQFSPHVGGMVMADWARIARALAPSRIPPTSSAEVGAPEALDAAALRDRAAPARRPYSRYAAESVDYSWHIVPDQEAAFAAKAWPSFSSGARS